MILVISGGTCSGKTKLADYLCKHERFKRVVSCTTRKPRDGEIDGVDYWFITEEKFKEYIESGRILEYVQYGDNYYGSLREGYDCEKAIAVLTLDGAVRLRELLYGWQDVKIVYLDVDELTRSKVYENKDREQNKLGTRLEQDLDLISENEELTDLIVHNYGFNMTVAEVAELVLKELRVK